MWHRWRVQRGQPEKNYDHYAGDDQHGGTHDGDKLAGLLKSLQDSEQQAHSAKKPKPPRLQPDMPLDETTFN